MDGLRVIFKDNHWFNRDNQRVYIFQLASKLLVETELSPEESLDLAEKMVQTFFDRHINKNMRVD